MAGSIDTSHTRLTAPAPDRLCTVDLEEKYAIALGILSILLWGGGWILGKVIADAPPRVIRTVMPIAAMLTMACFAVFVAVARYNTRG